MIAPAVPEGSADSVVSGASTNGIPAPALAAYQRGAQIINAADKSCNIPWELIAAIGRVESDHGRYGGNTLTEDGVSKPGIYGIALNGKNGTQAINDTDGGQLDKDTGLRPRGRPDAVHPLDLAGRQGRRRRRRPAQPPGHGRRLPGHRASTSAPARTTCPPAQGQEAAVYRYNHSQDYVNLVLRIMEAYSSGDYTAVPSGTYGGTSFSSLSYSSAIDKSYKAAKVRKAKQQGRQAASPAIANGTAGSGERHRLDRRRHRPAIPGTSGGGGRQRPGSNPVGDAVKGRRPAPSAAWSRAAAGGGTGVVDGAHRRAGSSCGGARRLDADPAPAACSATAEHRPRPEAHGHQPSRRGISASPTERAERHTTWLSGYDSADVPPSHQTVAPATGRRTLRAFGARRSVLARAAGRRRAPSR